MEQKNSKRPIALPITLLLLVLSVMGNVLLSTKNIDHSQRETVEAGQSIYDGFVQSKTDLEYWGQYMTKIEELSKKNAEGARMTATHMRDVILNNGKGLAVLMTTAQKLSSESFAHAPGGYEELRNQLSEELLAIGDGSGAFTAEEQNKIERIKIILNELSAGVEKFHFGVEGNRSGLIRLAGGYEWLPIAEALQNSIKSYTNGKVLTTQ